MEDKKNTNTNKPEGTESDKPEIITTKEEREKKDKEALDKLRKQLEEQREKSRLANEAISEGKGRFHLETPIKGNDKDIDELEYDFTKLTGLEYTDAMDSDQSAMQIYRITYRQGLALFAAAVAKEMPEFDKRDIIERIGVTDAIEGVQLATLFFTASTRAGRMRISKR